MRRLIAAVVMTLPLALSGTLAFGEEGWVCLFNGKNLDGWRANENPDSFRVEDGAIVVNGPRGHLFYEGPVQDHNFKNFHFKADVMTRPNANSGIYIHTRFQEEGWPSVGYEIQVNITHRDPKKSGGLYAVADVADPPAKDDEWYTQEIIVQGKRIISKINGQVLVDYTEPDGVEGDRKLSSGTFAIQAHDPGSKVLIKNIKVKPLDD
ncbi:MAG: DUF1080 domain-containing protein [Thermoguttaceae bacterium]|jgi:hypothetical protein|nr:DUF1080 domain-containing protein [Thermoguttaceae bacterium]